MPEKMKGSTLRSCGLAVLRIVVGVIFVMHGWQKLSWGFEHVAEFLGSLHVPMPTVAAVVLTLVELLGGIALILGVLVRYVAAMLAIDMLAAIILVHFKNGFFASKGGVEFPLLLLAANIDLMLSGAGALSVSALRRKAAPGP
ncbi:MAG TPA: DoxX family protein [Terriglobales bacterium]|nr:DoxX family protein [Terriglobales bacterium]